MQTYFVSTRSSRCDLVHRNTVSSQWIFIMITSAIEVMLRELPGSTSTTEMLMPAIRAMRPRRHRDSIVDHEIEQLEVDVVIRQGLIDRLR
jgi:hypothetical protein